ncbi:MAG: DeoR/GlpR family DNA-binding transcription regulator [Actinobacteria bacterium]|nr:DeoR/GlpR family DNA-binding transcription regulator [Actinomycetota bacterium]
MLAEERRLKIIDFAETNGSCTVQELSQKFAVTLMTINRDLRKLGKEGKLKVVRGGAIAKSRKLTETSLSQRINFNLEAKLSIADKAIKLIEPNDSIFLDSSSTSIILARKLKELDIENVTIITNSTQILSDLIPYEKFNVLSTGGTLLRKFHCFVGPLAELLVSQLRVNKFFFSVGAVSINGELSDTDIQEVNLKKKMIEVSNEKILMVESYKFNKTGLYKIINIEEVDMIINDGMKSGEPFVEEIRSKGLKIII